MFRLSDLVSDLIVPDTNSWNFALIQSLFPPTIVRNTCPLCESAAETIDHILFLCSFTKQVLTSAFILEIESLVVVSAPKPVPKDVKWFPPDNNSIKINFDASFNISTNSSVTGIVARNFQGLVMAACTFSHSAVTDAFTAEALACETAVTFVSDLGFNSVQVEGDSLSIIKKLNATTMDRSLLSPIISDIQNLRGSFDSITFSFVSWKGNMVAHELAKLGTQFSEPM
ncbi:hypothetical protein V6N13_071634 [Hibiscus sabdariffa]